MSELQKQWLINGNVLDGIPLEDETVQCVVTSPPYFNLRDYGIDNQIGLEESPQEYVEKLVQVFREVKRVLKPDGVVWLNLGDSYASQGYSGGNPHLYSEKQVGAKKKIPLGLKPKDLIGIPWRVAFALQEDGWWLRQDIIWEKKNCLPESIKDRCTRSHEYLFMLTKSKKYYYNAQAIKEPVAESSKSRGKYKYGGVSEGEALEVGTRTGQSFNTGKPLKDTKLIPKDGLRNKRSVWTLPTGSYKGAHFAVFPKKLVEPCILAGSKEGDTVFDPFAGSGTTLLVAKELSRKGVGMELNLEYIKLAQERLK